MTEGGVLWPPAGWGERGFMATVISNYDHSIDKQLAARLREGGCWARHASWDFNGVVWFNDGRWHETVWVHHVAQETVTAFDLEALMTDVNDKYGWG